MAARTAPHANSYSSNRVRRYAATEAWLALYHGKRC
jgi:hypothetical protein